MKKSFVLPIFSALFLAVTVQGCTTVKKGAGKVAEGTGSVVKGTGEAFRGVGGILVSALPGSERREPEADTLQNGVEDIVISEAAEVNETNEFNLNPFKTYPFKRRPKPEGDASDNQELKEKAWSKVIKRTELRLVGDGRVSLTVRSPIIMDVQEMEYLLLGRAAGEAARAGYSRFAIVYLNYTGGGGLADMFLPEISVGSSDWVGSYEELIEARENQRLVGNYSKFGGKNIEAVVLFLEGEDKRGRNTFPATEIYLNMLNEQLYNGLYPYKN